MVLASVMKQWDKASNNAISIISSDQFLLGPLNPEVLKYLFGDDIILILPLIFHNSMLFHIKMV